MSASHCGSEASSSDSSLTSSVLVPTHSTHHSPCTQCRQLKVECIWVVENHPCSRCASLFLPCSQGEASVLFSDSYTSDGFWNDAIKDRVSFLQNQFSASPTNGRTLAIPYNDLINNGQLTLEAAEKHFHFYKHYLSPWIHDQLDSCTTLAEIRARSSLLVATICTVASHRSGSRTYKSCFRALEKEVSQRLFATRHELEDIRALCIGAFWLREIGSILATLAHRAAQHLKLHRHVSNSALTSESSCEMARVFFLVHIADHHGNLPPQRMFAPQEWRALWNTHKSLESRFFVERDTEMLAEVELWSLSRRVFGIFGMTLDRELIKKKSDVIERFSDLLDGSNQKWLKIHQQYGVQDRDRGLYRLYFHICKMYLFSHAFRGLRRPNPSAKPSAEHDILFGYQQQGVEHAHECIRILLDDNIFQGRIGDLPAFLEPSIALSTACILGQYFHSSNISGLSETLKDLIRLCEVVLTSSRNQHSTLFSTCQYIQSGIVECHRAKTGVPKAESESIPLSADNFEAELTLQASNFSGAMQLIPAEDDF